MAMSVDRLNNAWVYFGTGRYIGNSDKTDSSQQYLYGIKDPFFNYDQAGYHHNFSAALTLDQNDLFGVDDIVVTTAGTVLEVGSLHDGIGTWNHLVDFASSYDGWYRSLDTLAGPSERSVSKSAVLGGIVFSPTFTPNTDVCGFGGDSNFYALYFETGTAYPKQILSIDNPSFVTVDTQSEEIVEVKLQNPISGAPPPSVGIHVGREEGARVYLQQSTGQVVDLDVDTAFNLKSGLTNWREQ
jgi:type IV pilus assembly protein PilY1